MLGQISDVAPKAVVIGAIGWAALNWALVGPEMGSRMLHAEGLVQTCERNYQTAVQSSARIAINNLPKPTGSDGRRAVANMYGVFLNGPLGKFMDYGVPGGRAALNDTLSVINDQHRQAQEKYDQTVAEIKTMTTAKLGKSGDYCGCVADQAVRIAQNDFALYSGTLSIFKPAGIRDLKNLMHLAQSSNSCKQG